MSFRTRTLGQSARRPQKKRFSFETILSYVRAVRRLPVPWATGGYGNRSRKKYMTRGVIAGVVLIIFYALFTWFSLPDISNPTELLASQSTVITDRNGIELYRLFNEEDRTFVPGEEIPQHMKYAIISIEDKRYYERGCLDLRAIARVIVKLGSAGGGSTITRQLARNALNLQQDNRYQRKVKEFILGCQLESEYSKEKLLELYLNWIPFGQNAYGIEQAAKQYFDTPAKDLSIAQSAVLAALPQRPSYFNPFGRHVHTDVSDSVQQKIINGSITNSADIPEEDITIGLLGTYAGTGSSTLYVGGRTDQVLRAMEDSGFITSAERLTALEQLEVMQFTSTREDIRAPHFVLWVRDQVEELFAGTSEQGLLEQGGLRIETTLDWNMQQSAQAAVERYREDIQTRFGAENIALVSIEPETNEVVAYVGNMDYNDTDHGGKIDMAQAPRQPGSSFKPFVYAAAFQQGYSPATPIYDVPTKIGNDEPQNFDGGFMGLMTMRQALGASRNVPAAKAYFLAGEENQILTLVSSLGAQTPLLRKEELQIERGEFDYGWPLALGAAETPLLEMVNAYGGFARGGTALPIVSIKRITDKTGNILYENIEEKGKQVLDERVAYQITSVLSDESARPEEYWRSQLTVPGYRTAAKTGTSNKCLEWKDTPNSNAKICLLRKPDNAWLMGYTPNLVTGVWVGNADSAAMYDKAGGLNTASPIWKDFMVAANRQVENPKTTFTQPDDMVTPQISLLSGEFPTDCTPVDYRKADIFLKEHAPSLPDPACRHLTIDKVTKLLASEECPIEAQEEGEFLVAHSLLPERWPQWEEGVQQWVSGQMTLWYDTPDHSGAIIPLPVAPLEKCRLELTPGRLDKPTLAVVTPPPNGSATYPIFTPRIKYESAAKILDVSYAIDGSTITTVSADPFTEILRVPRSISESGRHTLTVTLRDEYYNTVTSSVQFTFEKDERAPQVRFLLPKGDITLPKGGELHMQVEADDQEGGLKYVQFYLDDTLLTTKPKAPFEMFYTITQNPGVYILKTKAIDVAGNSSTDIRTLTVQ